jgi:high-affinity nickel permease
VIGFFSILAIGFFLGIRHATDPDHVVAVTTIVSRQSKLSRAAVTGLFWGIGHTLTILVVGGAIILFGVVIPARIGLSMEFSVALMLIVLGIFNVISAAPHSHPHTAEDGSLAGFDRILGRLLLYRQLRPLLIGVVHGLAGSAAVALLVLATIRDARWAVAYLLLFGLGTVAGMMLITMSIASAFSYFGRGRSRFSGRLAFASGLISLGFGLLLVYQIGFTSGLLTGHPQWTPR